MINEAERLTEMIEEREGARKWIKDYEAKVRVLHLQATAALVFLRRMPVPRRPKKIVMDLDAALKALES